VTLKAARTLGFDVITVGDHIKRRRLELGLFQEQAAKRLGVCESTVKNWEKGYNDVPIRAYPAILALLGYDPHAEPRTLAERLVSIRRRKGWTVRTAARAIGVDEETWRRWEAGRAPAPMHQNALTKFLARNTKLL
jgi:transcriptional regulator with XRE-family HTH domain